ncbi:MAG: NAD(P)H-dependent glycerol-3-phosphate dehydrogenase [Bacteroidota bacterium]
MSKAHNSGTGDESGHAAVHRIAVIGAGSWATAIIKILCEKQVHINWWMRKAEDVEHVKTLHHNPRYLTDIEIDPRKVKPTDDLIKALHGADTVILAVPSAFLVPSLSGATSGDFTGKTVISAIKGMVPGENIPVTDYLEQSYGVQPNKMAVIAGPCHAEEIALERLSYLTICGTDLETAEAFAAQMRCRYVKAGTNDDLYGVEFYSVMKNIVAMACGICHGLNYGDNFQAVLVANAIREIKRFVDAAYPRHRDLNHSAYMGDLLVTAYSLFSRNRTFGNLIGRGYSVTAAQAEMNMIAEGYYAVRSIHDINSRHHVHMPIVQAVYSILYEKVSARQEIEKLRDLLA